MSALVMYGTAVVVAMGFGIGAMLTYSPPKRPCYRCGMRVAATARRCRHCGYLFE